MLINSVTSSCVAKLATFLGFVSRDILSSKPLVQDVQHFSTEIDEEQGQSP